MVSIKNSIVGIISQLKPRRKPQAEPSPGLKNSKNESKVSLQEPFSPQVIPSSPSPTKQVGSARRKTSEVRVVDEEVIFNIKINYNDEFSDQVQGFRVRWTASSMLDVLEERAEAILRGRKLEPSRLHRTSGKCCLVRSHDEKIVETKFWTSKLQWEDDLPLMIMEFYIQQVKEPFYLDIWWNYEDQAVPEVGGETYATTIHKAIARKMTKNWEDRDYISQSNLQTILSKSTISTLVERDKSLLDLEAEDLLKPENERRFVKDVFIEDVWADAIRHLAMHVCIGLPLACLFEMMQRGARDRKLFVMPLTEEDCPHEAYLHIFKMLIPLQSAFIVHNFAEKEGRPIHETLHNRITVPIKIREMKGKGGFGEVFSVAVENEHHSFACEEGINCFAMKIFTGYGPKTEDDFNRESEMLQTLADFPHKHITPHLASWTQNGRFYMLFPLAKCNLRTFLKNTPAQTLDREFVQWLLEQFRGIAEGVRMIHNLGPANLGPGLLDGGRNSALNKGRTGFHHDLKPENILVFETEKSGREVLRISDFGSAKVSQLLSGSGIGSKASYRTPGQSPGDPIYGAPETADDKGTSRPYDIWSLGCIFLEILLWVFRIDLQEFPFERLLTSKSDPHMNYNQAFWYKSENGDPKLKPAVTKRLKELMDNCTGRGFFEGLVTLIRCMLAISPKKRITAPEICNALDALRMHAERDLRDDPEAYQKLRTQNPGLVAPPTTVVGDVSSLDLRDMEILTPSPSRLIPNGFGHHRRRSDGRLVERPRIFPDLSTFSDLKRLKPIQTDLPITTSRPRSPSIAISHYDNPESIVDGLDVLEDFENPPPVGAHSYPVGFEEFVSRNGRPRSSKSQRSYSDPVSGSSFGGL